MPARADLARFVLAGALGMTAYQLLLAFGEEDIAAGTASLLIATSPLWVALFARLFLGERLGPTALAGVAIAFTGAAVVALSATTELRVALNAVAILGAAICQALYIVLTKPLLTRYRALDVTAGTVWVGAVLSLPFAVRLPSQAAGASWDATLAVAYLGLVASAIGFLFWTRALKRLPASVLATVLWLVPPVATLIAWLWLGEVPRRGVVAGGALVIVGVAMVVSMGSRRSVEPAPASG
jgi:drug/metabolite transporter (DMT)-like permease